MAHNNININSSISIAKELLYPLENSEWNTSNAEWMMQMKCSKCAEMLYPYSAIDQYAWAERALYRWQETGETPRQQMLKQAPSIYEKHEKRPPNFNYNN